MTQDAAIKRMLRNKKKARAILALAEKSQPIVALGLPSKDLQELSDFELVTLHPPNLACAHPMVELTSEGHRAAICLRPPKPVLIGTYHARSKRSFAR